MAKNILKCTTALLILLALPIGCIAQNLELIPFRIGAQWGFSDSNRSLVIDAKYIRVSEFQEGFAFAWKDSITAELINKKGENILKRHYDEVTEFSNGFAKIKVDSNYGFINYSGEEVIKPAYKWILDFSRNRAWFWKDDHWGMIDRNGEVLIEPTYDMHIEYGQQNFWVVTQGEKKGVVDSMGNIIIPVIYDDIGQGYFYNLCDVALDNKCGFVNRLGMVTIPIEYDFAWIFINGVASASKNGKFGLIDTTGQVKVPFIYDDGDDWCRQNRFVVEKDGKAGCIDRDNNIRIPFIYERISSFNQFGVAVAAILKKTGQTGHLVFGLIDTNGKVLRQFKYGAISYFSRDGYAVIHKKFKEGVIDSTGKVIVPIKYDQVFCVNIEEGLAVVEMNNKCGYVNVATGKIVIPLKYDYACSFKKGYAKVYLDHKDFYINITGEEFYRK